MNAASAPANDLEIEDDAPTLAPSILAPKNIAPTFDRAILRPGDWPTTEPPAKFVISPLRIGVGRPNVFNGSGNIGKTIAAQQIGVFKLGGIAGLDGLVPAGNPCGVVHVDGDQGGRATRVRYHRLAATCGVTERPTLVTLENADGFSARKHEHWSALFKGHGLAIVDSLSSLLSLEGLDENSPKDTKAIMTALRAASEHTDCAVILITHSGHDAEDKLKFVQRRRPRGSSAIIQGAGSIWSFTGSAERGAARTVTYTRESEQDDGSDFPTQWAFRITTTDARADAVGLCGLDVQRVEATLANPNAEDVDLEDAIVDALAKSPKGLTVTGLYEKVRRGKPLIRSALVELAKLSVVTPRKKTVRNGTIDVYVLSTDESAERTGDL